MAAEAGTSRSRRAGGTCDVAIRQLLSSSVYRLFGRRTDFVRVKPRSRCPGSGGTAGPGGAGGWCRRAATKIVAYSGTGYKIVRGGTSDGAGGGRRHVHPRPPGRLG